MDLNRYIERFRGAQTHREKTDLYKDVFDADNEFRKLFARKREPDSWVMSELADPHHSLIPVFNHRDLFACLEQLPEEKATPKVFQISDFERKRPGVPSVVTKAEFHRNFDELFTEGALKYMNWDGVFAAGGSVLACLQPLPVTCDRNNRDRRAYMHDRGFPSSDIDLFLYGMAAGEAKRKIVEIYDAVVDANPFDVLCFRGTHAVTLVSQYPFRHIQIILRLYSSPFEVIAGFDVDSCAVGYDGDQVWVTPRCHLALVNQINPLNLTRRSPTYEVRLAKYARRGFEVPIPDLQRDRIDPTLFERPLHKVTGLAKLLLLERLPTAGQRLEHKRSEMLSRISVALKSTRKSKWRTRMNPSMEERLEKALMGKDEFSDYSTIFLPWGRGYTAEKCARLMKAKDFWLNSQEKVNKRTYKVHPCFFGTAETILKDCAVDDPPIPEKVEKKYLEGFVRGPLTFIEDDPGRQMIGSFHPISEADYCAGAYVTEDAGKLCLAANSNDVPGVKRALAAGVDPNCTDFSERTPLQLSTFTGSIEAAQVLLNNGAKISTRMPNGRTVLHIGAMYGCTELISKFLEKSKQNKEAAIQKISKKQIAGYYGGSSRSASEIKKSELEKFDILDLDAEEWTKKMSPLHIAIFLGEVEVVRALIENGADPNKGWQLGDSESSFDYEIVPILVLVINLCSWNSEASKKILGILIEGGCDAGWMDMTLKNILHMAAGNGNSTFIEQILEISPALKQQALDAVSVEKLTPLMTAIEQCHYECVASLIKHGARMNLTDEDCELTRRRSESVRSNDSFVDQKIEEAKHMSVQDLEHPLWLAIQQLKKRIHEVSVALSGLEQAEEHALREGKSIDATSKYKDPFSIVKMLLAHGADVNFLREGKNETMVDFVGELLKPLEDAERQGKEANAMMSQTYKQDAHDCKDGLVEMDDILVSEETGLPAEYKSPLKLRQLLDSGKIPKNSYVWPTLEAYALKFDIQFLSRWCTDIIEDDGRLKKIAYRKLLGILELAGGMPFWKLMGNPQPDMELENRNHGYAFRIPRIHEGDDRDFKALIATYSYIPPGSSRENQEEHCSRGNPTDSQTGKAIETSKQHLYHQLFEAAWRGDQKHIEQVTILAEPKNRLLISVQNSHFQTPLIVAMLGGHADLAFRILEIAAMQYESPDNEGAEGENKKRRLFSEGIEKHEDDYQLNNFAVEAMVEDDFEEKLEKMKMEAEELAENVTLAKISIDADAGSGSKESVTCHTSPEDLLNHMSYLSAEMVEANLPENWRKDAKEEIRLLWKSHTCNDKEAENKLRENFHGDDEYFIFNRLEQNGMFRMVSPMLLALFLKRRDLLDAILMACNCWDAEWKKEAMLRKKGPNSEEMGKKSPNSEEMEVDDPDSTGEYEEKDCTKLACKLVAAATRRNLVFLMDDVELLSYLIEKTGYGIPFEKILEQNEETKRKTKTSVRFPERLPTNHPNSSRRRGGRRPAATTPPPYRHTPFILTATRFHAKNIIQWLSTNSHTQAFQRFIETNQQISRSASSAEKLAKKNIHVSMAGFPNIDSPAPDFSALAQAYGGELLVSGLNGGLVACALGEGNLEIAEWLMKQARAGLIENNTLLRTQLDLTPMSKQSFTPNALQIAAKEGRVDLFKAMLDFRVDPTPTDPNTSRGWNILAFILATRSAAAALEATRVFFSHPSTTPATRERLILEKMGQDKVTPVMVGVTMGHVEALEFLRSFAISSERVKAEFWSWQGKGGATVLHQSVRRQSLYDFGPPKNFWVLQALLYGNGTTRIRKRGEAEVRHAASLEDHLGLTAFDIAFNIMCKSQVERNRRSEIKQAASFHKGPPRDDQAVIKICIALREVNSSRSRIQPNFEDAKASATSCRENRAFGIPINTHAKVDNSRRIIMPPDVARKSLYRSPGILH
ncbi:hypothetical protein BSKO_12624 [Bryopsis sp. KO-2023]|nr:hypothetical protein BSKO_12624 [Bryopsis sp. KO-2023]